MRNLFILVFLTFVICSECKSQEKYRRGFILKNNGDTLAGLFLLNKVTPGKLTFKKNNGDAPATLLPDGIKYLSLGKIRYIRWTGTRNMTYVDKFDFYIKKQDSTITGSVFLKEIYSGKVISLYFFRDEKEHFFAGTDNSITELIVDYRYPTDFEKMQQQGMNNPPSYFSTPRYQTQIKKLAGDLTRRKINEIEATEFDQLPLIRLFKFLDL